MNSCLKMAAFGIVTVLICPLSCGDIFRWDNGEAIPGTEGIEPGPGVQLDNLDLTNADLSGLDLTGASFRQANLTNARLRYSNIRNADLFGSSLTNANLEGANLTEARLRVSTLDGANFAGAILLGAFLEDASLTDTDLTEADLTFASLSGASLKNTNLTGANLTAAWLFESNWKGVSVAGANLKYADLDGVINPEINGSAIYNQHTRYNTTFRGSIDPVAEGFEFQWSSNGDFDASLGLRASDVDALANMIRLSGRGGRLVEVFDLNGDLSLDHQDHRFWVTDLKQAWFGDANLDGEFNSSDLVAVFEAGEYEDSAVENSGWADGDWNGDGDFTSGDLVVALQDGGYEQGPRPVTNAVPEPTSLAMLMAALIGVASVTRSRRSRV